MVKLQASDVKINIGTFVAQFCFLLEEKLENAENTQRQEEAWRCPCKTRW